MVKTYLFMVNFNHSCTFHSFGQIGLALDSDGKDKYIMIKIIVIMEGA